jgi:hypothetical protein
MPEVTISLTIRIPDGATLTVNTDRAEPLGTDDADEQDAALGWMEEHAPAPQQRLLRELLDRLRSDFDLVGSRPSTGSRPYLNFYPGTRYGTSRVGAVVLTSGRFYAVLDPSLAPDFPGSEPAEGKYLTCYIRADGDIDLAASLMQRALEQRGWENP